MTAQTPTPAPALTDERVRMFYACAYAWRTEDSVEDGESDLSEMRARQGAEFDRWLAAHDAAVIARAKREAAEEIAGELEAAATGMGDSLDDYGRGLRNGLRLAARRAEGGATQ